MAGEAVVIGDALIDEIHDDHGVREFVGGAALNVAVGLRRLGVRTTLIAMVGNDDAGARIRDHLSAYDVRLIASDAPSGTSRAIVQRAANGEPVYVFNEAARGRSIRYSDEARAAIDGAALVAISCFPFDRVAEVDALIDALGDTRVAVDPNPRSGMLSDRAAFVRGFERMAPRAALVKVGADDAALLYDDDLDGLRSRLRALGVPAVLATAGAQGAVIETDAGTVTAPISALPGPVIDTVGAGDATLAAVAAALVEAGPTSGHDWAVVLRRAMDVAAATCRAEGGLLRTPESTSRRCRAVDDPRPGEQLRPEAAPRRPDGRSGQMTSPLESTLKEPRVIHDSELGPLLHFAPERNWMNDPNGLVFHKGRHHLYYQCNPYGSDHAHISWGHASSADLVTWEHHPVAITADDDGQIFSGSIVLDVGNTSGLGTDESPALVAFYTLASSNPGRQAQALAYSTDDGMTWTKYSGNPVLDRGTTDFRDPKVFRYEGADGGYWVMVAVEAVDRQVLLHRSDDLITWSFLSAFGPARAVDGVWECPDLFPLAVDGDESDVRWVLLISLNPGGVAGGSGTQYVIGHFDGVTFTPDDGATGEQVAWLDYGRDCYAGVTFDGLAPDERTLIAWMSNWDYAHRLPYTDGPLQSAMMTLPRRLSLTTVDGRLRLRQRPIAPVQDERVVASDVLVGSSTGLGATPTAGRISLRVDVLDADGFALRMHADNAGDGGVVLTLDRAAQSLTLDRRSGAEGVHALFGSAEVMPYAGGRTVDLEVWVDRASVEVFAEGGTRVLTDLIAPQGGRILSIEGVGGTVRVERIAVAEVPAAGVPRATGDAFAGSTTPR
ncbi:PfkB family carbohydrate kinase [Microbacterium sp.]